RKRSNQTGGLAARIPQYRLVRRLAAFALHNRAVFRNAQVWPDARRISSRASLIAAAFPTDRDDPRDRSARRKSRVEVPPPQFHHLPSATMPLAQAFVTLQAPPRPRRR